MAEWLNYHHLLYFWTTAREGSVTRASEVLHLAQPTVSGQIRELERSLGVELFHKQGRNLALTDAGREAFRYADEIFGLGQELIDAVRGRSAGKPTRFVVGAADSLPKLIVRRLLEPALRLAEPLRLVVVEGSAQSLLGRLAVHELDIVLSDVPASPLVKIRAFNHLLGECGVTFFASSATASKFQKGFPKSLDGAPMLMPSENSAERRSLEQWFGDVGVRPVIRGEFEDSALTKAFGQDGLGLFAAPTVIAEEVCRQFRVAVVGQTNDLRERFYAISVERRLKHPAVIALTEAARQELFR